MAKKMIYKFLLFFLGMHCFSTGICQIIGDDKVCPGKEYFYKYGNGGFNSNSRWGLVGAESSSDPFYGASIYVKWLNPPPPEYLLVHISWGQVGHSESYKTVRPFEKPTIENIAISVNGHATNVVCPGSTISAKATILSWLPVLAFDFTWEYKTDNNASWQTYTASKESSIEYVIPENVSYKTIQFRVRATYKMCNTVSSDDRTTFTIDVIPPPPPIQSVSATRPVCPGGEGSITITHSQVQPNTSYTYTITQYRMGDWSCPDAANILQMDYNNMCSASPPAINFPTGKYFCKGFIGNFKKTFSESESGTQSVTLSPGQTLEQLNGSAGNAIHLVPGIYEVEIEGSDDPNVNCICRYYIQIPEADPTPAIQTIPVAPSCLGGNDGSVTATIHPRSNYNAAHQIQYTLYKAGAVYEGLVNKQANLDAGKNLTITNLITGSDYQLTVYDGCTAHPMITTFSIGSGPAIAIAGAAVQATCVTQATGDGRILFTASAVPGKTYSYDLYSTGESTPVASVSGQGNTYSFTGLKDLSYYGIAKTSNGCTAQSSQVVVLPPASLQLNAPVPTNPTCSNSSDGSITLTGLSKATGDVNFSYVLKHAGNTIASESNITSLSNRTLLANASAGNYTLTITDHCKNDAMKEFSNITLISPLPISIAPVSSTLLSCFEDMASVDISVLSPGPAYTLDIKKNNQSLTGYPKNSQPTGGMTVSNLAVDNVNSYTIIATEKCSDNSILPANAQRSFTVQSNASAPLSVSITKHVYGNGFNLSCREAQDGIMKINIKGGVAGNASTSRYNIELLNSVGTVLTNNQTNNHTSEGAISAGVAENGGYTFTISGLTHSVEYTIRIHDFNAAPQQCEKTVKSDIHGNNLLLNAPLPLAIKTPDMTNDLDNEVINPADGFVYVTCKGDANINFRTHISGGTAPYTVTLLKATSLDWEVAGQQTGLTNGTGTFSNLGAGNYKITVDDQYHCAFTEQPFTIREADQKINVTNLSAYNGFLHGFHTRCYDTDDARISITGEGGINPYTYRLQGSDGSNRIVNGKSSPNHEYIMLPALDHTHGNTPITYTAFFTDALGCAWTPSAASARTLALSAPEKVTFTPSVVSPVKNGFEILCKNNEVTIHVVSNGGAFKHNLFVNGTIAQQTGTGNLFSDFSLIAGHYSLKVQDAEGCESSTTSLSIDEPATTVALNAPSVSAPKCIGGNDGKITVSAHGGIAGASGQEYFFQIKPEGASAFDAETQWGTSVTFLRPANDYTARKYIIRVTDSHQCYAEQTVEMPVTTTPLRATVTNTKSPSCYGADNGSIQVKASDYEGLLLTFGIAGGHLNEAQEFTVASDEFTFTGLYGTNVDTNIPYTIWVEDANHCTLQAYQYVFDITLNAPAEMILSGNAVRPACYNGSDGAIEVAIAGGVQPYQYSLDNSTYQLIPSDKIELKGLASQQYTVYVRDAHYDASQPVCQHKENLTVEPGRFITLSADITQVYCKGGNDGAIDLTASVINLNTGESFNKNKMSLVWTHDNISSLPMLPATEDLLNIYSGAYTVKALYSVGSSTCSNTKTFVVTEPANSLQITIIETYHASCGLQHNGKAVIHISGGWPGELNYYQLDNGPWKLFSGSSFVISNLAPGTHEIYVSQGAGYRCMVSRQFVIEKEKLSIQVSSVQKPSCPGAGDGAIVVGDPDASVVYSLDGVTFQPLGVFTGLSSGTYNIVAKRETEPSCQSNTLVVGIDDPVDCGDGPLSVQVATTLPATCETSADGIAHVLVSGGVPPYRYFWDGAEGAAEATALSFGKHSIEVRDAMNTSATITASIDVMPVLAVTSFTKKTTCAGNCNGEATLLIHGGSGQYKTVWKIDQQKSLHRNDLCAGDYAVVIYDTRNVVCSTAHSIHIESQPAMAIQISQKEPTCHGGSDGALKAEITGGSNIHTVLWSTGSTTKNSTGLHAGTYSITATDAVFGCMEKKSITLQDAIPMNVSAVTVNSPSCYASNDGKIVLATTNVINPLVVWSNGQIGLQATKLVAGTYQYTVTGSNGCQLKGDVTVEDHTPLDVKQTITEVTCHNYCDGAISLSVSGGVAPYEVSWNHGAKTAKASALCAGTYGYTVRDRNQCVKTSNVTLVNPSLIQLAAAIKAPSCYGSNDGRIDITPTGGKGNYNYAWNTGEVTATRTNLKRGGYTVTVRDVNACAATRTITLSEPGVLHLANEILKSPTCFGLSNGSIEVKAAGGSSPYRYAWNGATGPTVYSGLPDGQYNLRIADSKGCVMTKNYTLKSPAQLSIINVQQRTPACAEDHNGSISLEVEGGASPYTYTWSNRAITRSISNLPAGSYAIEVDDKNGCKAIASYTLTDPAKPMIAGIADKTVVCSGSIITMIPEGKWSSYLWTGPQNFKSVADRIETKMPGAYNLTVHDNRNCPASKEFVIETSINVMQTDFLRISEAVAYEPIVFVDISTPLPDETEWIIPKDDDILVNRKNAGFLEVTFMRPGNFEIGLKARSGNCAASLYKIVSIQEVTSSTSDQSSGRSVREALSVSIYPNPARDQVNIKLVPEDENAIELHLYSMGNNRNVTSTMLQGHKMYELQWNLAGRGAGVYRLVYTYKNKVYTKKIVMIQ
jgi:hypothetical protein